MSYWRQLTKDEVKTLLTEQADKLREAFPSHDYHVVNNYGYGDGAFYGPYDAVEAMEKFFFHKDYPTIVNGKDFKECDLVSEFASSMDSEYTHYIMDGHYCSVGYGGY